MTLLLNQADKAGGDDPLAVARRIADRYAGDLRSDLVAVVPMIGLLAETAHATLREADVDALRRLARVAPAQRELMLLSAERFERADVEVPPAARGRLLELLDLFGLRSVMAWVDAGAGDATALERRLRDVSGIAELERHIEQVVRQRADVLRAHGAIARLERVAYSRDDPASASGLLDLREALDGLQFEPEMHALNELWALGQVGSGAVSLPADLAEELREMTLHGDLAERRAMLGGDGDKLLRAAADGARRWQAFVNETTTSPAQAAVGAVMRRTYENLWRSGAPEGQRR